MPDLTDPVVPIGKVAGMSQPELHSDSGLDLRAWNLDDVPTIVEAYSDPAIQQWHFHSMTDTEAAEWIAGWEQSWRNESDAGWAVVRRGTGSVVGRVGLRRIRLSEGQAEVSYWVMPAARGQGVATAATLVVSTWAFSVLGLHRLELAHSVKNSASCQVATKTGFPLEGTRRSALRHPDGWHDMHLHARLDTD